MGSQVSVSYWDCFRQITSLCLNGPVCKIGLTAELASELVRVTGSAQRPVALDVRIRVTRLPIPLYYIWRIANTFRNTPKLKPTSKGQFFTRQVSQARCALGGTEVDISLPTGTNFPREQLCLRQHSLVRLSKESPMYHCLRKSVSN